MVWLFLQFLPPQRGYLTADVYLFVNKITEKVMNCFFMTFSKNVDNRPRKRLPNFGNVPDSGGQRGFHHKTCYGIEPCITIAYTLYYRCKSQCG